MNVLEFPLTKVALFFLLGILSFRWFPLEPVTSLQLLFGILLVVLVFFLLQTKYHRFSLFFGIVTALLSFSFGFCTSSFHKETYKANHFTKYIVDESKPCIVTVELYERLRASKKNERIVATLHTFNGKVVEGNIIVNFKKNQFNNSFQIGDVLQIKGVLYKNKPPFNPNQFDYGVYLENQEIYGQLYCKDSTFQKVGHQASLWSQFSNYRDNLIRRIEKTSLSNQSLQVFIALLLGQQQGISPEVLKDYQYAGAVHILSVSGLHVGFIMLFILFVLKPFPNTQKYRYIKLIIAVMALWSFALLAGLSPSVVRSVTMFSFLLIGNHLNRNTNIFHTLLVSMLLILLWKPSFLFDVGFQLSYLALFFILWLQPLLKSVWTPKNKIIIYFWDIVTVSTAAQLGTMPLSIYYFHQFPELFFITNLVILPLLGVVMASGILLLLAASVGYIPQIIVTSTDFLLKLLNSIIHYIAGFEDFVLKNISFSKPMLFASYLLLITWILWFKNPKFKTILIAFLSIIILQNIFLFQRKDTITSSEGIVFNIRKGTLITERIGKELAVFADDSLIKEASSNPTLISYAVGNFCDKIKPYPVSNFLYINGKKITVINQSGIYNHLQKPDILLLINSPKINLERTITELQPKIIIADGSNYKSYSKLWEQTCLKKKIPFHNSHEKGFYRF